MKKIFLFIVLIICASPTIKSAESIKEWYKENKEDIQAYTKSFCYGATLRHLFIESNNTYNINFYKNNASSMEPVYFLYLLLSGFYVKDLYYAKKPIHQIFAMISGIYGYNKLILKK